MQDVSPKTRPSYFLEIDGLRALAIFAVLVFHLQPSWLPGGFLGVDVFFVISGFLITRLILPQIAEGQFSFRHFYLRRAKRLLPVFLLMLVMTWIAAWLLFFPDGLLSLSKASFAAVLSFANYEFAKQLGYFAPAAETNPLLHTWSLAVEEQFYLLFPLIMVLVWQKQTAEKKRILGMIGALALLFSFSWLLTLWKPNHAFYALESRAWELGMGCLTAILFPKFQLDEQKRRLLSWLGLGLCITSFITIHNLSGIPAPAALMPTIGVALAILSRCGGENALLYRAATWAPIRYLGRISYSLYLFHWPVIVFYKAVSDDWHVLDQLYCAAISLGLAILVHHSLENPVRVSQNPILLKRLGLAGIVIIMGLAIGSKAVRFTDGYIGAPNEVWLRRVNPDCQESQPPAAKLMNIGSTDHPAEIILIGDSHAQCLVSAMNEALVKEARSGAYWVAPATLPALGTHTSEYSERFTAVLPKIAQSSASVVVICASWPVYISRPEEEGQKKVAPLKSIKETHQSILKGLSATVQMLLQAGKRVVLIHPIPRMDRHVPEYMARTLRAGLDLPPYLVTKADYLASNRTIYNLLSALSTSEQYVQVYPQDWLSESDHLLYQEDGLAFYKDSNHVTKLGAQKMMHGILSAAWSKR